MINAELMSISMNKMRSVTLLDSGITMNQVEQNCELIQSLFSLNSGCSDSQSKSGKNLTHHFLGLSHFAKSIFSALSFGFTVYQINCCRRTGVQSLSGAAPGLAKVLRWLLCSLIHFLTSPPISSLLPRTLPSEADYLCLQNGHPSAMQVERHQRK